MRQRDLLAAMAGTLALFSANLPAEHWPKVTKRDIWRGLPPDPRRLRLVDEA